jgi:membrane protease YdiL (CAAX protease family)
VALDRRSRAILFLLNAPVGLVCAWLFWTYGIEAAIIAHFCVDIVYHVCGAAVLRRKLAQ